MFYFYSEGWLLFIIYIFIEVILGNVCDSDVQDPTSSDIYY